MTAKLKLWRRRPGLPRNVPRLTLLVRGREGLWARMPFIIDTGADYCALPASLARSEGIGFRRDETTRRAASGLVGSATVWRDTLAVMLFGEVFEWPCQFVEGSAMDYGVLGREGFLDAFDVCVGQPWLRLTRRLPWWRKLLDPFPREFDPEEPL